MEGEMTDYFLGYFIQFSSFLKFESFIDIFLFIHA